MSDVTREDLLTLNVPQPVPYEQQRAEMHVAQKGKSRAEIAEELAQTAEAVFDPETATKPGHNFVDRGLYMVCEGAGHPSHRSMKSKSRPREEHHVARWLR